MMNLFKKFMSKSKMSNNTAPKLASIFFAVMLWIYVMDIENPETMRTFNDVPVQLIHTEELQDNSLVLMNTEEFTVDVMIEGRRNDVLDVKKSEIIVSSDLLGYGKGTNSIPVDVKLSEDNVKISKLSKNEIKVDLDRLVRIPKNVIINIDDNLPGEFKARQIMVSPQQILVEGPEVLVNSVSSLVGEVGITEISTKLIQEVPIKAIDSDGNIVSRVKPSVEYVDVELGIDKYKTVNLREAIVGKVNDGYELVEITLEPKTIIINGSEPSVDSINTLITKPIDISNVTKEIKRAIELVVPEGVNTQYLENPVMATISVEEIVTKTFTYTIDDVNIFNLKSDFDVRLMGQNSYFEISIDARDSLIKDITKEDLILSLNLENHISGRYSKSLSIQMNSGKPKIGKISKEINIEIYDKEIGSEEAELVEPETENQTT